MEPDLTMLANLHMSDKGAAFFDAHHYTRVYEALFLPLKLRPVKVLEVGLLHPKDQRWTSVDDVPHRGKAVGSSAPSLAMWSAYFPQGEIHGLDINDFSGVHVTRCAIHRGDASKRSDLRRLARHGPFDIIIDDASHASSHQQITLSVLFASVKPGGFYIIEDLQWQPTDLERAKTPKTKEVLRRLEWEGVLRSPHISQPMARAIEQTCERILFFDSLNPCNVVEGRDALAVLVKRS